MELYALQETYDEIVDRGASLVAVSPEQPFAAKQTSERHDLSFPVLFDENNQVARRYGLVFQLAEELKPVFENVLEVDIAEHNGVDAYELPMPATYVIDGDQTVVESFVHEDYTKRMEPADILRVLESL